MAGQLKDEDLARLFFVELEEPKNLYQHYMDPLLRSRSKVIGFVFDLYQDQTLPIDHKDLSTDLYNMGRLVDVSARGKLPANYVAGDTAIKKIADEIEKFIKSGKIKENELPELVKSGLDPRAVEVWEKTYKKQETISNTGTNCCKCKDYYPYASGNQADGTFKCWGCRQ